MNIQVSTTPEQSQRLITCGVGTDTSDMCYIGHHLESIPYEGMLAQWMGDSAMKGRIRKAEEFDLSPAWSLSRLLSLLPKEIEDKEYGYIWCEIVWIHADKNIATVRYYTPPSEDKDDYDSWEQSGDLIEACIRTIEWLTENNYKLTVI